MAITIGDALLKLGVDTKDLDRGLQGIKGTIQKHHKAIGLAMTAAGGAILAAGALSIRTFAQMGDEVQKMALRTGFSTEALSELRHAADLSGASLAGLEKASRTLSGAILDAGYGLETYVRAFDQIGLSYEDLAKLKPEDQFTAVMEALAGVEDESTRAALATDLFGRAGTQLLPMLSEGTMGLAEMREEAHKLGIVFDQEAANKAAEFNDAMTRMKESVSGVKMVIAEQLIPVLLPMIDKIKDIISGISAWAKENPELFRTITLVTGAVALLLVPLGTLLILLPQLTAAYGILSGFITATLIPRIIALITTLWAQVAALFAVMVAMGPVGWALAATGMALLTTGLILLNRHHTQQLEALAGATGEVTEATQDLTVQQRDTIDLAREEAGATEAVTEAVEELTEAQKDAIRVAEERNLVTWGQVMAENARANAIIRARRAEAGVSERPFGGAVTMGGLEKLIGAGYFTTESWERLVLPYMQEGGIAMRPMVASIAERQPEAVIPLDRFEMMGGGGYKTANIYLEVDGRVIAQIIGEPLVEEIRARTGVKF